MKSKILAASLMVLSAFALTLSGTVPADAKHKKTHAAKSKAGKTEGAGGAESQQPQQ